MSTTCPHCDAPPDWHQVSRHLPHAYGEVVAVIVWQPGFRERPAFYHPRQTAGGCWYVLDGAPEASALLPMAEAPLWRLRTAQDPTPEPRAHSRMFYDLQASAQRGRTAKDLISAVRYLIHTATADRKAGEYLTALDELRTALGAYDHWHNDRN